jgi:hypothetical protein
MLQLLLKRLDALFDVAAFGTFGIRDEVVLVQVQGVLRVALASICLRQVEEEVRIGMQPVGFFELHDGVVPFAKVEVLLALLVVLARLFRLFIVGSCYRWHGSQGRSETRRNQDKQNGRNVIPGTQGIGRSTAHRVRPSLTKKRGRL